MFDTLAFFLIIQICLVVFLILAVLFQKSSSDGLAGLSGGGHNFVSSKASGNIMTKLTFFLAAAFMINSLLLAKITIGNFQSSSKLLESISITKQVDKTDPVVPLVPNAE